MVAPPPDVGRQPAAPATAGRAAGATRDRGAPPPSVAAPALDRADIKPLDLPGALQILIAEVREAFEQLLIDAAAGADAVMPIDAEVMPIDAEVPLSVGAVSTAAAASAAGATATAAASPLANAASAGTGSLNAPTPAARGLVQMVLQALPETLDDEAWGAALPSVEAALRSGVERAMDAIGGWRDVPAVVVESTAEAAALALRVLDEEPRNPLWLLPEWLDLRPRLSRFWRRRRAHRRRLTDPDHESSAPWDEADDFRP